MELHAPSHTPCCPGRQVYDDPDAVKLNDVCEFIGVLSRVPGLAMAQLEAQTSGGGGGGPAGDPGEEGLLDGDELARDEALAMTPTSLVRVSLCTGADWPHMSGHMQQRCTSPNLSAAAGPRSTPDLGPGPTWSPLLQLHQA